MKVKFLIEESEDEDGNIKSTWKDMHIKEDLIIGFYIPDVEINRKDKSVNVVFGGLCWTFKQEKHLLDYLYANIYEYEPKK